MSSARLTSLLGHVRVSGLTPSRLVGGGSHAAVRGPSEGARGGPGPGGSRGRPGPARARGGPGPGGSRGGPGPGEHHSHWLCSTFGCLITAEAHFNHLFIESGVIKRYWWS